MICLQKLREVVWRGNKGNINCIKNNTFYKNNDIVQSISGILISWVQIIVSKQTEFKKWITDI